MKLKNTEISSIYLYDHIKKTVDLPAFVERETGANLIWQIEDEKASANCPIHNEKKPSFHLNKYDGIWMYHCFGCGAKGTIIDFCMDYFGLSTSFEAVVLICKKLEIKNVHDIVVEGLKNVSKKVSIQKKMECQNIVISNICRQLLREDFNKNQTFVAQTYKRLNEAMDNGDNETLQIIDQEVFDKRME
jgi:DNA primase